MAIAAMKKVMIASHRSESQDVLEALQREGIVEVLNAEQSMVSKEWPELQTDMRKPRELEDLIGRLESAIAFLKENARDKGSTSVLRPRVVIDEQQYNKAVSGRETLELLERAEQVHQSLEELFAQRESLRGRLAMIEPWRSLEISIEEMRDVETVTPLPGTISDRNLEEARETLIGMGADLKLIGTSGRRHTCIAIAMQDSISEVQKALRNLDFETVNFEDMRGKPSELLEEFHRQLEEVEDKIENEKAAAVDLAPHRLHLQILADHYHNLLKRETAYHTAPATENVVLIEGWVKKKDYKRLDEVVGCFSASNLSEIEPGEEEHPPVEIENPHGVKPFEVVTELYGMPQYFELDPTALLAPFFAIFFALCLTDAGYAIVLIALTAFAIMKMQAGKKLVWLLLGCSVVTIAAGALTGGWFGDGAQQLAASFPDQMGWLSSAREQMMWFDPFEKPMVFFGLATGLGYLQIMVGLLTAFVHNLMRKHFVAALFDQATWIVMLNALVVFGAAKMGATFIPAAVAGAAGYVALVPAILIFLFSQREGPIAGRIGFGAYNLFSTIFFLGDVLSYLRLMALGMVTGGLAIAINVIAKTASEIPYIGIFAAILVLIGGHLFNTTISALSAFVHTLRLQYVEFFPKFLQGGGRNFNPLRRDYSHIYLPSEEDSRVHR